MINKKARICQKDTSFFILNKTKKGKFGYNANIIVN